MLLLENWSAESTTSFVEKCFQQNSFQEIKMAFKDRLKELRKQQGWTQDELGEKIGVHGRHVGKYEIGKAMPKASTLIRIAELFDTSLDYLLLESSPSRSDSKIQDQSLLNAFEKVDKMDDHNREIIAALLDAFIKKYEIENMLLKTPAKS